MTQSNDLLSRLRRGISDLSAATLGTSDQSVVAMTGRELGQLSDLLMETYRTLRMGGGASPGASLSSDTFLDQLADQSHEEQITVTMLGRRTDRTPPAWRVIDGGAASPAPAQQGRTGR